MRVSFSLAAILAVACSSQLREPGADVGGSTDFNSAADGGADASTTVDLPDSMAATDATDATTSPDANANDDASTADATSSGSDASTDGTIANDAVVAADAKNDIVFSFDAGAQSDSNLNTDAACAQTSVTAEAVPLDMYVMLDRSASMNELVINLLGDCDVGGAAATKWCYSINALADYFKSNDATGNAAAIQFFPIAGGVCGGNGYSTPASPSTGFRTLPTTGFNTSLNAQTPEGNDTPLEGAIRGITGFTSTAANQRVGRKLIGVLITDGDPTGTCSNNVNALKGILSTHFANTGITTFVVGMTGATFTNLETIAEGGGAPIHNDKVGTLTDACGTNGNTCRHWNVGNGNGSALTEALKQIQKSATSCTFAMPTADGGIIDPNQVKVSYRPGGTGTPQTFARVTNAASCTSAGGFYYDNNMSPTSLTLCSSTCGTVQADSKAKVDVLLGCLGS